MCELTHTDSSHSLRGSRFYAGVSLILQLLTRGMGVSSLSIYTIASGQSQNAPLSTALKRLSTEADRNIKGPARCEPTSTNLPRKTNGGKTPFCGRREPHRTHLATVAAIPYLPAMTHQPYHKACWVRSGRKQELKQLKELSRCRFPHGCESFLTGDLHYSTLCGRLASRPFQLPGHQTVARRGSVAVNNFDNEDDFQTTRRFQGLKALRLNKSALSPLSLPLTISLKMQG